MNKNDLLLVQSEPSVYNITVGTTTYNSYTYWGYLAYEINGIAAMGSISYKKFKGNTIVYLYSTISSKYNFTYIGLSGPTGYQKITITRLDTGAQVVFEASTANADPNYLYEPLIATAFFNSSDVGKTIQVTFAFS